MQRIKKQQYKQGGFTLLETVLYIALLAILIGGGISSSYGILEGSARTRRALYREQEAYFIARKIDAVISEAGSIAQPSASANSTTLATESAIITISTSSKQILLSRLGGSFVPLNSTSVPATRLTFEKNNASSTVTATFTLDGHNYSVSAYYYERTE